MIYLNENLKAVIDWSYWENFVEDSIQFKDNPYFIT